MQGFECHESSTVNQIYKLPLEGDGSSGDALTTDGAGNLSWSSNASEKSWFFSSPAGSGTHYAGGFYFHSTSDNDFSPIINFGTANVSYAAHFFVVLGAVTTDELTIRVTGTSITDTATRTTSDTEDIVIPNSTPADSFYETSKKWIGQVSVEAVSGTAKICDYGHAKYWDNNNTDYKVAGLECTWLAGASDTGADIRLRHHKGTAGNTDWTYTGTGATPPAPIASLSTDHGSTEDNLANGESGAWKRTNLASNVDGSASEGIIWEIITSSNKAFDLLNMLMRIVPQ